MASARDRDTATLPLQACAPGRVRRGSRCARQTLGLAKRAAEADASLYQRASSAVTWSLARTPGVKTQGRAYCCEKNLYCMERAYVCWCSARCSKCSSDTPTTQLDHTPLQAILGSQQALGTGMQCAGCARAVTRCHTVCRAAASSRAAEASLAKATPGRVPLTCRGVSS